MKLTSVYLFISLIASYDLDLNQLDIRNAFLHGDFQEEGYTEQPLEFLTQEEIGKVCCPQTSQYGLKRSSYAWFGKFS